MNKLIITANPSIKAFTHTIANKFKELSINKGDTVEILDLYRTDLKQDFLSYEVMGENPLDETTKKIQEKITWADELVFVFPIWWGDCPAIMKNFIDSNFLTGFAFKYENGKSVGLLKGKSARIIATSGAPSFFYKIILHIQFFWNMNRIGFCGLKQKSFTVFGNIDRSATDKNKYLSELEKLV
ncbi:MAG: NAD(P)H-dependent oxidoreductase [Candidatus Gracilibacteria bacterium]|nr:NAD(P)H-dependent oxidoreductase [Candidatus Gracilibacteria bacterium]